MKREEIEKFVEDNKEYALLRASEILGREVSWSSFNGIIGSKNGTYSVDPCSYPTAEKYIEDWHKQHNACYESEKNSRSEKSSHRIHKLLQDKSECEYIDYYLARTYYRKNKSDTNTTKNHDI